MIELCSRVFRVFMVTTFKGPCPPKRLCALVVLFWPGSFVECCVLIGCYFPSDNFQLREIPVIHSGLQWAFKQKREK